jgi:hypothetical protein
MTITARQPSLAAASATPWAWLPADAQITPRLSLLGGEVRDLVVGAAQLEGKHRLQILALQQHTIADAAPTGRRGVERRFDRDVVDLRVENWREP